MKLITGMQRSGTSLVARLFAESGADMGDPDSFYRPDQWNLHGYYEQPDIHAINMPLINGPWGKLAYLKLPTEPTILKRSKKLEASIRETGAKYKGKVVKETRFCLTLSAWLKYGTEVDRILVCLRDPIQTARSLNTRYHLPLFWGLKIWYLHNVRLLTHARDIPQWYIYYGNLLDTERCLPEIQSAMRFMELDVEPDPLQKVVESCINTSMNHHPGLNAKYAPPINSLWQRLLEKHQLQENV